MSRLSRIMNSINFRNLVAKKPELNEKIKLEAIANNMDVSELVARGGSHTIKKYMDEVNNERVITLYIDDENLKEELTRKGGKN